MKKFFYNLLMLTVALAAVVNLSAQTEGKNVYMLVASPGIPGDNVIKAHLETLGHTVTVVTKADANVVDAATNDIMFISATISSGDAAPFKDLEKPIMTTESYALSPTRLSMTEANSGDTIYYQNFPWIKTENDTTPGFEYLKVSDDADVVAAGLTATYAGQEIFAVDGVATNPGGTHCGVLGRPNKNALIILTYLKDDIQAVKDVDPTWTGANLLDSVVSAAFVYDKGVEMGAGFVSPERRGFFFFHDNTAEVATDAAWEIFDLEFRWLLGEQLVGINELKGENANFNVYPSVVKNELNIQIKNQVSSGAQYQILDITGKQIMNGNLSSSANTINLSSLNSGIYVVKMMNGDAVATSRVVKQ